MNKVWIVMEENEYQISVVSVYETKELTERCRDLFQNFADEGDMEDSDLNQTFYGTYYVLERFIATKDSDVEKAWYLSPRHSLPDGWQKALAHDPVRPPGTNARERAAIRTGK